MQLRHAHQSEVVETMRSRAWSCLVAVLCTIGLAGCHRQSDLWPAKATDWSIIVPARYAPVIVDRCRPLSQAAATTYWTPSQDQVRRIESSLLVALDSTLTGQGSSLRAKDYLRQYAGMQRDEARWIYVAGAHRELYLDLLREYHDRSLLFRLTHRSPAGSEYWRRTGHGFCDAGYLAFAAKIDAATYKPVELVFSGP